MFEFYDLGRLIDDDLGLVLAETNPGDPTKGYVPAYVFKMTQSGRDEAIGRIALRIGDTHSLVMYGGQIGYSVESAHRGHRYAARSVKLILPLARSHAMKTIWITCDPANVASRRTCELAGAEFVEIVDLPTDHEMYQRGDRQVCRYRLDL